MDTTHDRTQSAKISVAVRGPLSRWAAIAVLALGVGNSAIASDYNYEPELDAMFSQVSFGNTPIDIRFLPTLTITSADLSFINSATEFAELTAMALPLPTVSAFFVDGFNWCGGPAVGVDGCAGQPAHSLALQYGVDSVVFAHELGHNLGLGHSSTPGDIMGAQSGFSDRLFTTGQVASIFNSNLVQTDARTSGRFIQIQTYDVFAVAAVPEPSTYALFALGGLFGAGYLRQRKAGPNSNPTTAA